MDPTQWSIYNYTQDSEGYYWDDWGEIEYEVCQSGIGDELSVNISGYDFLQMSNTAIIRFMYSDTLSQSLGAYSFTQTSYYISGSNSPSPYTGHSYFGAEFYFLN